MYGKILFFLIFSISDNLLYNTSIYLLKKKQKKNKKKWAVWKNKKRACEKKNKKQKKKERKCSVYVMDIRSSLPAYAFT